MSIQFNSIPNSVNDSIYYFDKVFLEIPVEKCIVACGNVVNMPYCVCLSSKLPGLSVACQLEIGCYPLLLHNSGSQPHSCPNLAMSS